MSLRLREEEARRAICQDQIVTILPVTEKPKRAKAKTAKKTGSKK